MTENKCTDVSADGGGLGWVNIKTFSTTPNWEIEVSKKQTAERSDNYLSNYKSQV